MTETLEQMALRIAGDMHILQLGFTKDAKPVFQIDVCEFARRILAEQAQQEPVVFHENTTTDGIPCYCPPTAPLQDSLDAKLLDAIILHGWYIGWTREGEHCRAWKQTGEDGWQPVCGWKTFFESGRAAIDAAIHKEEQP